jgi:hypothetical protein
LLVTGQLHCRGECRDLAYENDDIAR